jgi:precorrin-3B synthase
VVEVGFGTDGGSTRVGDDACPGTLRPHHAADGELVRIRVPGGALGAPALAALAAAAAEFGDGRVGLTSRANVQLRGLAEGDLGALTGRLRGAGLLPAPEHERVRNILASPLSGRGPGALDDIDPLTLQLDAALCARPGLAALPGRFLFAVDDGSGDVAAERPDVLALALGGGRYAVRHSASPGGGAVVVAGATRAVNELLALAEAFLVERAACGSRAWRIRELPDQAAGLIARLAGPVFWPRPGGAVRRTAPGLIDQHDGRLAVCAAAPLGLLDQEQAAALGAAADLSDAQLDRALRITPWRRVVVRDLQLPAALAARELLEAVGLVLDPGSAWSRLSACAGRPGCGKALADVHADARAFAARCRPAGVAVHWAGCERGCGTPAGAVSQVIATRDGYVRTGAGLEPDDVAALAAVARAVPAVTAATRAPEPAR